MTEVLFVSNVAGTPTTPAGTSDVAIFSGNVHPNQYQNCKVETLVEIGTTGTSGTNNNLLKLKIGGAAGTTLKTVNFKTDAVARTLTEPISYVGDISQGGALVVTLANAVGADANTTFTVKHLYVHSLA